MGQQTHLVTPPTATGSTRSTSCTSGPGARTSRAPSSTGTPPSRAPASCPPRQRQRPPPPARPAVGRAFRPRGHSREFPARVIDTHALTAAVKGTIVLPGDPTYDGVRTIWNAMIDRRPAVIVRCAGAADVVAALGFARERGLEISIRGGGHNIAGTSVCDGGVMIDLSQMRQVRVDAAARRAYVEPGALLADVDQATLEHGLATPLGINSTTGVAGLTLGGGFGWLSRTHGLTIDNLVSVDVVGADGTIRRASANENADLFWAIRGGGGNFGVVTEFEFALHPCRRRSWPASWCSRWRTPARSCGSTGRLRRAGPRVAQRLGGAAQGAAAALPAGRRPRQGSRGPGRLLHRRSRRGRGPDRRAARSARARRARRPGALAAWQQAFDPLLAPGARNYWKSHNFTELGDGAIEALASYAGSCPRTKRHLRRAGVRGFLRGTAAVRPVRDFRRPGLRCGQPRADGGHGLRGRETRLVVNVHARWEDAAGDQACIGWARNSMRRRRRSPRAGPTSTS